MTTFYDLLNIDFYEIKDNIKIAYKNKIKNYKYKNLNEEDILEIKQLKTGLFILLNDNLRELYNNLIFSNEKNEILADNSNDEILVGNSNDEILAGNSNDNNSDLNSLFSNIINNSDMSNHDLISLSQNIRTGISNSTNETTYSEDKLLRPIDKSITKQNIPNTKSTSLEKMNNFMNDRIFSNINHNTTNKIIYNSLIPIQTREDRKLN